MTYDILRYIFIGAEILSGILLIVSVILFIILKIPRVIGDLTGSTARKAIEDIRNQNENSGNKVYKSSSVNKSRAKITDKISPSGNIMHRNTDSVVGAMATTKIATQKISQTENGSETTVLGESSATETTVLGGNTSTETTVLSNETSVLFTKDPNKTVALDATDLLTPSDGTDAQQQKLFEIEYDITYIHTDELIA